MPQRSFATRVALLSAALALAACAGPTAVPSSAPDGNWALHGHDLGGQRLSPLALVDTGNVDKLVPKWTYHSGVVGTFQTTPIVVGRVMYVSLPFSSVAALDATTGRELWHYRHQSRLKSLCCGPANRGVAVAGGKVYVGTVDGRLVALDANDGRPLWDITVADYTGTTEANAQLAANDPLSKVGATGSTGVGIGAAPLVHGGRVYIGINGVGYGLHPDSGLSVVGVSGQYGRPGLMAAFDAETGRRVWQFDMTGPGWEGEFRNATPDGVPMQRDIAAERAAAAQHADAWRYGGGSVYASPVIDAERGLLYFGSGNPSPQMADASRPGDNLYTSSLIALDLKTGRRVWHYQQTPHDRWGYDVASSPVLLDLELGGQRVAAVAEASKLGWVYVHDRATGKLLFKSDAFVPQMNLFTPPQPAPGVLVAPGIAGGANWSPSAYDAARGLFFVGALDLARGGRMAWQVRTDEPLIGGVLATAGGLVFSGAGRGMIAAFDSSSGRRLWQYQCDAGVNAPPITYAVDGKQYVAVAAGGNALFGFKQGDAVVVFGLP